MKRIVAILISVIMILSVFTGCASKPQETTDNNDATNESSAFTFTDDLGRTVEIDGPIKTIVATAPLGQIMLFALAPEMFVGISIDWDDTALVMLDEVYCNLPVIGQLYGGKSEVNLEELVLLNPDVIIDIGESKGGTVSDDLNSLQDQTGIPIVHIEGDLYTMPDAYRKVGKLLNKEAEAEAIATYYEGWLNNTFTLVDSIGKENLAKIVYCSGENGLSVLANGAYHAQIIDLLTNNIAVVDSPSGKGTGNPIDMEQLLLWNPDYIIFSPDGGYDNALTNETWQQLKAISSGNFAETPYGPYNWMGTPPSVQRVLSLIWLPAVLYPEYINYDVYEATAEYFQIFYHCELTREQFDILTENSFIK